MDILKRSLAPITDEAWKQINETAANVLKASLSARRLVEVAGPHGWNYAAVPTGRLDMPDNQNESEVNFGLRTVQPLVESRVLFELDIWELDNASRGAQDLNLDALEEAARKIALFEETAVYRGFEQGRIKGLKASSSHKPQDFSGGAENLLKAVSDGIAAFAKAGVCGPFRLVVGNKLWSELTSRASCYPLMRHLERLLDSEILLNALLEETVLISLRGGDMKLTLGNDFAIGFNTADAKTVSLYFTESFTFEVYDGSAIMPILWQQ